MSGKPRNLRCQVATNGLRCAGSCQFKKNQSTAPNRVDKNKRFDFSKRSHSFPTSQYAALPEIPEPQDLKGAYLGYIHHESLNRYQAIRLNVRAFKYTDRPNRPEILYLSATSWIYFGDFMSDESIGYKFAQRPYLNSAPEFMFEGTGEVFFKVIEWTSSSIKGLWFSKVFGRVGTVQLLKNVKPDAIDQKELLSGVSGRFDGVWKLDILPQYRANSDDFSSEVFYPYDLLGTLHIPDVTAVRQIDAGTFDFYTNTLSLRMSDGRVATGRISNLGLDLFISSRPIWNAVLGLYRLNSYQRAEY